MRPLLGDFIEELAELESKRAELDAELEGMAPSDDAEDDGDERESTLDEAKLKVLRRELAHVRKALKARQRDFAARLAAARRALDENGARALVLGILRAELNRICARYVAERRDAVVALFENWWDKYRVTLPEIERDRDRAVSLLSNHLTRLGYER